MRSHWRKKMILALSLALGALVLTRAPDTLPGNASGGVSEDPITSFILTYNRLVYENYSDSLASVRLLGSAIDRLLENPSKQTLADAKSAWLFSRESYGQTEVFRFYGGHIDYFDE